MNYFSSSEGKHTPEQSGERSRESLTSRCRSSRYLHSRRQPWNYTENGIVTSGASKRSQSHYGERAFILTSSLARGGKQGAGPAGPPQGGEERFWFSRGDHVVLRFSVLADVRRRRSACGCRRGGFLSSDNNKKIKRSASRRTRGGLMSNHMIIRREHERGFEYKMFSLTSENHWERKFGEKQTMSSELESVTWYTQNLCLFWSIFPWNNIL